MNGTQETWHGSSGGYTNHGCRCKKCRAARAIMQRETTKRRKSRPIPDQVHATANGYSAYGCRCDDCRCAYTAYNRARLETKYGRTIRPHPSRAESKLLRDWRDAERVNRWLDRWDRDLPRLLRKIDRALSGHRARGGMAKSFERMYEVNPGSGCWNWLGNLSAGYGSHRGMGAHRWAYLNAGNLIEEGLSLDHTCHTYDESCPGGSTCKHRSCVNPEHLEPVTRLENVMRGRSPGAMALRTGVCNNGHPFTGDNVRVREHHANKSRECVQCNRDRSKRYRENKKMRLAEKRIA